jgi:NAD(P)-dependent dehydrogenase (short-subunit alcohol dehydrogenase family)
VAWARHRAGLARAGFVVGVNHFDTPDRRVRPSSGRRDRRSGVAVRADVRVPADVQAMVADADARYGRLDVFVNNAGIQTWKPLLDVTEDEWDLRHRHQPSRAAFSAPQRPRAS